MGNVMNIDEKRLFAEAKEIAAELGVVAHSWEDEEVLSPKARVTEKEYFGVLDRPIISQEGDVDQRELTYFAGDDPRSETTIGLSKLKTSQSRNDDQLKWSFVRFCVYLVIAL